MTLQKTCIILLLAGILGGVITNLYTLHTIWWTENMRLAADRAFWNGLAWSLPLLITIQQVTCRRRGTQWATAFAIAVYLYAMLLCLWGPVQIARNTLPREEAQFVLSLAVVLQYIATSVGIFGPPVISTCKNRWKTINEPKNRWQL